MKTVTVRRDEFKEYREPKPEDDQKYGGLYCEKCELLMLPESEDDIAELADFVTQHQDHSNVWSVLQEEDGWVLIEETFVRPPSALN
jgi:hypothetical protein